MNLAGWILKKAGWSFAINIELPPKCVVCVAPHTSNWDFVLGELCIRSVGRTAGFLMKNTWFFFPMGVLLRRIGGIAVKQHQHTNVTEQVVQEFAAHDQLMIAVTPEGTRSNVPSGTHLYRANVERRTMLKPIWRPSNAIFQDSLPDSPKNSIPD